MRVRFPLGPPRKVLPILVRSNRLLARMRAFQVREEGSIPSWAARKFVVGIAHSEYHGKQLQIPGIHPWGQ
jgi:hypothetical protein